MNMPEKCPSCGGKLLVTGLECASCGSRTEGTFQPCPVCALSEKQREIFDLFMAARGNLKEVQRVLGVSYPTARNRVLDMFEDYEARSARSGLTRMEILGLLRDGKINADEAEELLRGAAR